MDSLIKRHDEYVSQGKDFAEQVNRSISFTLNEIHYLSKALIEARAEILILRGIKPELNDDVTSSTIVGGLLPMPDEDSRKYLGGPGYAPDPFGQLLT